MSDSLEWLDHYDRVVAAAADHLPEAVLGEMAAIARDQRERRAYAGTALLVGLAGGTGSGKSSLLNASPKRKCPRPGRSGRPPPSRSHGCPRISSPGSKACSKGLGSPRSLFMIVRPRS